MRLLITGAEGQLGHELMRAARVRGHLPIGADRKECDLSKPDAVRAFLEQTKPEAILHAGAYTAVDLAESEPELAFSVNEVGTRTIAEYAGSVGCTLLYISTDYVFSGEGFHPWEVTDSPSPLNVYGASKWGGEMAVRTRCPGGMVVRTSWLYGAHGENFVKKMLALGTQKSAITVVNDQIGAPTYAKDLSELLITMIERPISGIYHATNTGYCSRVELAEEIFSLRQIPCTVQPVPASEFMQPANRPKNSRLSDQALRSAGYNPLRPWEDALRSFLEETRGSF